MEDEVVFVDTSMFYALINAQDEFHTQAKDIWKRLQNQKAILVTSNYILDETFTRIRSKRGVEVLNEFRKNLAGAYKAKIIRVIIQDEARAWDWLLLDWSNLSFTDCVSFALMKRVGIKKAASFDNHFRRAGFELVL